MDWKFGEMQNKGGDNIVNAHINIVNCTNVTASISIRGFSSGLSFQGDAFMKQLFGDRIHEPKTSAKIYIDYDKQFKECIASWGRRRLDDSLLEYKSKYLKIIHINQKIENYPH